MKYLVDLFWSEEDGGYIAVVPDLPGCSAFGATPEAAVHEIGDAIEAWIAAYRAEIRHLGGRVRTASSAIPNRVQTACYKNQSYGCPRQNPAPA